MDFPIIIDAAELLSAGITLQGTGFERDLLPGIIGILAVAFWMFRGAPVSPRAEGGFNLLWILVIGFILWGLFAPPISHGANAPPDPAGIEARIEDGPISDGGDAAGPAWNGIDIMPLAIPVFLFLVFRGEEDGKKRAILPFLPFLLALSSPGLVHAADVGMEAASGEWWRFPFLLCLSFASIFCAKLSAIREERPIIIAGFVAVAFVAGFVAVRNIPEAHGFAGNFFESDGTRAIREAEADRIRTENELVRLRAALDAERQRALLRAASPPAAPAPVGRRDAGGAVGFWMLFAVAALGAGMAFHYMRQSERAAAELRRIAFRLEIAERERAGFERDMKFLDFEPNAGGRHGR